MRQFFRFLTVGVFNTVFGYCIIFACMYGASASPEVSNVIGYAVGLTTSYLLNRHYTFRSTQRHRGEIIRFLVVFAAAYAANFVALLLLIRQLGIHEGLSQILAGAVYVLASYAMNKLYVFRKADAA